MGGRRQVRSAARTGIGLHRVNVLFFGTRLLAESLPFATRRPGLLRDSAGRSSPSTGGLPLPARSTIRKVSARSAPRPLSRRYSSVRKAETFSATATLMSWFRATPCEFAAFRNSSSKEGCSRNAKLLRLKGSHPVVRFHVFHSISCQLHPRTLGTRRVRISESSPRRPLNDKP
jgi:hypothetical protein